MGFGIALKEVELDDGLVRQEILDLYDMLDDVVVLPLEIMAREHECSAIGFVTLEAANIIDSDCALPELKVFIASILDDMNNENEDCIYEFKGIRIWLSR